eukprot:CAMPEP_0202877928 /NCGR_PEP_ID=MMETSP1391-20130828/31351_1 /ASSEMBLY_ACC=CAM_ASM_000867 /TAXON_ID=1034604 /ORGANISM="Chlamydomonas leiostraca, Strain SAG 11-49" /LENGTH=180 /DNA_ID=CAMNT_0049560035 /DNA_START=239 /DNA_END=778 /DNA_ORIENTATION=+
MSGSTFLIPQQAYVRCFLLANHPLPNLCIMHVSHLSWQPPWYILQALTQPEQRLNAGVQVRLQLYINICCCHLYTLALLLPAGAPKAQAAAQAAAAAVTHAAAPPAPGCDATLCCDPYSGLACAVTKPGVTAAWGSTVTGIVAEATAGLTAVLAAPQFVPAPAIKPAAACSAYAPLQAQP